MADKMAASTEEFKAMLYKEIEEQTSFVLGPYTFDTRNKASSQAINIEEQSAYDIILDADKLKRAAFCLYLDCQGVGKDAWPKHLEQKLNIRLFTSDITTHFYFPYKYGQVEVTKLSQITLRNLRENVFEGPLPNWAKPVFKSFQDEYMILKKTLEPIPDELLKPIEWVEPNKKVAEFIGQTQPEIQALWVATTKAKVEKLIAKQNNTKRQAKIKAKIDALVDRMIATFEKVPCRSALPADSPMTNMADVILAFEL